MKTLFVVMPFGAIRPAIGVSLLQSRLAPMGFASQVLYLNMRFAQRVGFPDYEYVAERAPSQSLAGDWIFAPCLSGPRETADGEYLKDFAQRFSIFGPVEGPIAILERCRALAEDFLAGCLNEVDWSAFDVVGFTSTFTQHVASLALAKRLKARYPHLRIVFGGANCEDEMGLQAHRSFPFVDFVCTGEADLAFPRLIQALHDGGDVQDIPGVVSRSDGASQYASLIPEREQDLDTLPAPDYVDYFEQRKTLIPQMTGGVVLMESSRGCWWGEKHHCTFCGLNGTSMAFRSKSAERVLEEIAELRTRYQPDYIAAVDNILDMKYFRDLVPELARQQLKLGLFYETKANLSKAQIALMRRAGITTIQPGIESLSSDVLRLMRKGTTAIQNIQLLKWCKEYGIAAYWNLLYGFPGENPADYDTMATTMEYIHHLRPPQGIGPIRLDRFSPNFVRADEYGIINVEPDRNYRYIYDLPGEELTQLAYFFEHDYRDGCDPETYVGNVRKAVLRWHENSDNPGLKYADHGKNLAIWDRRPKAKTTVTILSGEERAIYVYCDQHRTLGQIKALFGGGPPIQPFLDQLVEKRLMIHLDGHYLSLATKAMPDDKSTSAEVSVPVIV